MGKYRVLSIDGGGVRGVIPAKLLERLLKADQTLIEKTDLIVGNSIGSFLALGLADGFQPTELLRLFKSSAKEVFSKPSFWSLFKPKYANKYLYRLADQLFGDKTLGDLKKHVVVPSFALEGPDGGHWRTVFFNNFSNGNMRQIKIKDAAMASTAAPTYFPSYNKHIDGGVFSNNPSTAGIAFATDKIMAGHHLDDVVLLSIGTGFFPYQIEQDTKNWGIFEWLGIPFFYKKKTRYEPDSPLIEILTDGVTEADHTISHMLLENHFYRLNPQINNQTKLDDVKQIPELLAIAEKANLTEVQQFIHRQYY